MNLIDLVKYIKKSDNRNKEEYMSILKNAIKAFVSYFNLVVDMEIFSQTVLNWSPVSEYMFKTKDENRRLQHELCISCCEKINQIAEVLDFDLYVDTENRHEVACFIGDSLNSIYSNGIHRNFDEMVMDYSKSGRLFPDVEIGDL